MKAKDDDRVHVACSGKRKEYSKLPPNTKPYETLKFATNMKTRENEIFEKVEGGKGVEQRENNLEKNIMKNVVRQNCSKQQQQEQQPSGHGI